MAEYLDPTVCFEIDTYWTQVGGHDPVAVVKELGARVPLLHIKDGPADNKDSDMVAVGEGVMDVAGILDAGTIGGVAGRGTGSLRDGYARSGWEELSQPGGDWLVENKAKVKSRYYWLRQYLPGLRERQPRFQNSRGGGLRRPDG